MTLAIAGIVATYGNDSWRERGIAVAHALAEPGVIAHLVHQEAGTIATARNRGAERAFAGGADYLLFVDADDELAPGYVKAMRAALHHHNLWRPGDILSNPLLLVPRVQYVHQDGTEDEPFFPNRHRPIEELNHCVIGTLLPARLFLSVGGFRDTLQNGMPLSIYEDWDAVLRLLSAGAQLSYVEDAIYRAHVRPGSRNAGRGATRVYQAIRAEHAARQRTP